MDLEKIIQDSLTVFIQSHIPTADLSGLDDIVFSYVTSVLEELGSPESFEETFDMETFMEMMEAYVPGFAEINSDKVCEMMISLSEKLREAHNKQFTAQNTAQQRSHVHSEEVQAGIFNRLSCSPVKGAEAQETCGSPENSVEMLMEMFPACIVSQAKEALSMARGNLEEAAQLILEEKVPQESANAISQKGSRPQKSCKQTELKEFILQKAIIRDLLPLVTVQGNQNLDPVYDSPCHNSLLTRFYKPFKPKIEAHNQLNTLELFVHLNLSVKSTN